VNKYKIIILESYFPMKIGIDLGGTKIEIIALDTTGQVLLRQRVATPQGDYHATVNTITELVTHVEKELGERGSVGIGTPGSIATDTGLLRNSNSVCLNGMPFKQALEQHLNRKITIANDANCFALSEAIDGAAKGANSVFGVIIGTGVGAGIVINQQVLHGVNGIAGEWGHNSLPWPSVNEIITGLPCYCGKQGCIETWLSGTGFANGFKRDYGKSLSAEAIVTAATNGNLPCDHALSCYEDRLARSLAQVINVLDPEVIVLGGGMSNAARLYENIPQLWGEYVFSDYVHTRLVAPLHGDSSGVRGAAFL
jgi:predicted NBD/HSP70 family sugar kinase